MSCGISCYCKEKNAPLDCPWEWGDTYTWIALDSESKLIISYLVGKRDPLSANGFVRDLRSRITARCQITSDGFGTYIPAIETTLWGRCGLCAACESVRKSAMTDGRGGIPPERLRQRSQPPSAAIQTWTTFPPAMWKGSI